MTSFLSATTGTLMALVFVLALLTGCGHKGPLTLPTPQQQDGQQQ